MVLKKGFKEVSDRSFFFGHVFVGGCFGGDNKYVKNVGNGHRSSNVFESTVEVL